MENQTPTLQDWLSSNPGKTPNDYFQAFPQALGGYSQPNQPFLVQAPKSANKRNRFEWLLWVIVIILAATVAIPFAVGYFESQNKWQEAGLPASLTMSQSTIELSKPANFIEVEILDYKVKLLKTSELKLILRNRAESVKYSNIVLHLRWLDKAGNTIKIDEGTFNRALLPGDDENFSMYDNPPINTDRYRVEVVSADAEVYR